MNNRMNKKELLELQMITTIFYIASLLISLILTYNDYLNLENKQIFSEKLEEKIGIYNRAFVVILTLSYLYINYQNRVNCKDYNDLKYKDLQVFASTLSTIAALIVLYVVINSGRYTITSAGNPNL